MTKVKICGLSTVEAVETAVGAGADFIGFVFASSRRQISLDRAKQLAQVIPDRVCKVGVFVSPSLTELEKAIATVPLDMVQIHGQLDEAIVNQVSLPIIRALPVSAEKGSAGKTKDKCGDRMHPASIDDYQINADFLLFDAPVSGSGKTFDWQQLDIYGIELPYFIAGGLTSANVKDAIAIFQPYAVDVSSGVETNGIKDLAKIRQFIERVKA
ncbi:phosphoribosylanthranilate isomerase [Streptococcus dentasini]